MHPMQSSFAHVIQVVDSDFMHTVAPRQTALIHKSIVIHQTSNFYRNITLISEQYIFFGGHVVSSDDRSIQIFATYSRNTTSVSPLRTHRKLGQLQEYDVTRIWKLRVQTSLVLETYELVTLPVLGQFWANYIPPILVHAYWIT